jgi:uncharacterized protein YndB with AHSA1/START domain
MSIVWPSRYEPGKPPIHVRNEIEIASSPDRVWDALIRAPLWPLWYANAANVVIEGGADTLSLGGRFRWRTFGVRIASTVMEFVPYERLAWDAHAAGVDAYHAWLIEPTTTGCHILTEETQYGVLARLSALVMPKRMATEHQRWLEGLKTRAPETHAE